jgi:hypothetical protein
MQENPGNKVACNEYESTSYLGLSMSSIKNSNFTKYGAKEF